jgi:hypothetical protein
MRPSSTKCRYIISHSDGSKLAVESGLPHGGASTELLSITDFFVFLGCFTRGNYHLQVSIVVTFTVAPFWSKNVELTS